MGVTRRLGSANALYGVLSLLFPPLAYIPGGALAAVVVVFAAIWGTNHFWVGPAALSRQRQRGLAKERLNQLRAERVANSVSDGRLLDPPEAWLDRVLADREEWGRWSERLEQVRVHDPRNRLGDVASLKLMLFLAKHEDDWLARQLAYKVFRVGGAHKLLYREVAGLRDPAEATYLFDALETRQLLADREYWRQHTDREVKPWAPAVFSYVGGTADAETAFGVFRNEQDGEYYARAAGERAPEAWRGCKVEGTPERYGSRWLTYGIEFNVHPDFGASYFRMNEIRGLVTLDKREIASTTGAFLVCAEKRLPLEGEVPLR